MFRKIMYFLSILFITEPLLVWKSSIDYNKFEEILDKNKTHQININEKDQQAYITTLNINITHHQNYNNSELYLSKNKSILFFDKCFDTYKTTYNRYFLKFSKNLDLENKIKSFVKIKKLKSIKIIYNDSFNRMVKNIFLNLLIFLFLFLLISILLGNISKISPGLFKHTDSPGKLYKSGILDIKLSDVIGLKETKEEVKQYIDFLKNREKYIDFGITIPRGLLFIGSPGCGKTLLAKAIASQSDVNFIYVSGSDFHEMFVGVGAARVRNLFKDVRKHSPCILFIDEIDSLGQTRSRRAYNSEGNSVLNKLLVEMDGFDKDQNVLVIAATNRVKTLDPALTRSGRFDRKLIFDKPNINERVELFELYLDNKKVNEDTYKNLKNLAKKTANLTGADIMSICNQAGIICIRNNETLISINHLELALEEISIGNVKKERLLSEEEKIRVAYHEAGHCLLGYLLKYSKQPIKVSIIPRGEFALGYSQPEPSDQKLYIKEELYSKIVVLFGGRVAEEIKFKTISTGASDDFKKASKIAESMVVEYGFENSLLSYTLNFHDTNFKYISEKNRKHTYDLINSILENCYEFALSIIKNYEDYLEKLAQSLLENETITDKEIDKLIDIKYKNSVELNLSYNI